ncbi:MAG: PA2778 family cysteine peptidase [Halieaceae bacterium]|nr:PA2778 family cysteine peptidase [Halieaceae bacterium]
MNPRLDLAATLPGAAPVRLESVPFYPQLAYQCGPAALAGVLGAAGAAIDPAALAPRVYLPDRQGSLQAELVAAARRSGLIPYLTAGQPAALLAELQAGRPVLVIQNLGTPGFPRWHYAVMTGFDPATNRVFLNTGDERGLAVDAPEFLRTWDWAGRWAMVVLSPGQMPAGVDLALYTDAVIAFENVAGAAAAVPAWQTALERWPQAPAPYLALGNRAYFEGNLAQAVDYYARGLRHDRDDPALGNNLASVLGELGCAGAGIALLEPIHSGLPEASGWRPVTAATLAELSARTPGDKTDCAARYSLPDAATAALDAQG